MILRAGFLRIFARHRGHTRARAAQGARDAAHGDAALGPRVVAYCHDRDAAHGGAAFGPRFVTPRSN